MYSLDETWNLFQLFFLWRHQRIMKIHYTRQHRMNIFPFYSVPRCLDPGSGIDDMSLLWWETSARSPDDKWITECRQVSRLDCSRDSSFEPQLIFSILAHRQRWGPWWIKQPISVCSLEAIPLSVVQFSGHSCHDLFILSLVNFKKSYR